MKFILLLLLPFYAVPAAQQNAAFPLESVTVEGSAIPQPVILEIAGLRLGAPISKSGIEAACTKLHESGLFASLSYNYRPGPKGGYALTLLLADHPLKPAVIDVPGVDEDEAWRWLSERFPLFDSMAPEAEAAQRYLAGELERHLGSRLRGQRLAVRIESDLKKGAMTLAFQPEVLPKVLSVAFSGNAAIASTQLAKVLDPIVIGNEYSARKFLEAVELNLRPLYEQHGYYRVRFAPGSPRHNRDGVSLGVAITEGDAYQLREVEIAGEDLPVKAMLAAAKLPQGKLANWRQIQSGIWEMEKVVKRTGYFEATAAPERSFDDAARVLDLRIRVRKGPLYRFGEIRFTGLAPDLEARARRIWKPRAGDPYDFAYPYEFLEDFSRAIVWNFRKYDVTARKGAGEHVMDIDLVFESR